MRCRRGAIGGGKKALFFMTQRWEQRADWRRVRKRLAMPVGGAMRSRRVLTLLSVGGVDDCALVLCTRAPWQTPRAPLPSGRAECESMAPIAVIAAVVSESSPPAGYVAMDASGEQNAQPSTTAATALVQLYSQQGDAVGAVFDVPLSSTPKQLTELLNHLLNNETPLPYAFFVRASRAPLVQTLEAALNETRLTRETVAELEFVPLSLFRVRAVSRCSATLPGHKEAVLVACFSPDCSLIATGSGDTTVRLWSAEAQLPKLSLVGHRDWVLALAFSPEASRLASASKDGRVWVWDVENGTGKMLASHRKWVTDLCWKPYHLDDKCSLLVSASKDGTLRIWNAVQMSSLKTLAGHTAAVTTAVWSGEGVIYSASQDRTIKIWNVDTGLPMYTIQAHAHWVNSITLSTDYILKCGAFASLDERNEHSTKKLSKEEASQRYQKVKSQCTGGKELMVSGSDDFTLMLWEDVWRCTKAVKPITRMTGHQQLVNCVAFSPDGRYIASASFDKSVRLWDGKNGKFCFTFRGHVAAVYRVVWSADGRLLMSGSKDSTCKVWDVGTKKLKTDLPGHSDEVFTVDWSTDGKRAVSAGKDKLVKIWHH